MSWSSDQRYPDASNIHQLNVHPNRSDQMPTAPETLSKYSSRYQWLRDERFLKDLEGDSVDTEILDEELRSLDEQQPKNCRDKTLKFLESNPFQIALCLLVLADAGIVICEILVDLHATRGQYREATSDLFKAMDFFKAKFPDDFKNNSDVTVPDMIEILRKKYTHDDNNNMQTGSHLETGVNYTGYVSKHILLKLCGNAERVDMELPQYETRVDANETDSASGSPSSGTNVNTSGVILDTGYDVNTTTLRTKHAGRLHRSASKEVFEVAHILHYCSIAILGVFVIQLLMKIIGFGRAFFHMKMELFDAAVILSSFAMDIVFLEGIESTQGEEAAALLIIFLLWRILRVINGIMVTTKKRQEFRIKLQKRTRRKADRKIEFLEEEKHQKNKEISLLKELCINKGASKIDISACKPKRKEASQKCDTASGLSAIASLSLGLSMTMIGNDPCLKGSNPSNGTAMKRRETSPRLVEPANPRLCNKVGSPGRWSCRVSDESAMQRLVESTEDAAGKLENGNQESVDETDERTRALRSRRSRGSHGGSVVRQEAIDLREQGADTVVIELANDVDATVCSGDDGQMDTVLQLEVVDMVNMHSCADQIVANHVDFDTATMV